MIVYMYKNKLNGKIYVGKTTRTLEERTAEHLRNSRKSYIDRALRKYGIENFEITVLAECDTIEELNRLEKFYIRVFNSKGRIIPLGQRLKISSKLKERIFSSIHKANISAAKMGHPVSTETRHKLAIANLGKTASDSTRAKMSASCKNKRPVLCIETSMEFSSITAAKKWINRSAGTIIVACKNPNRTAGGYHWKYLDKAANEQAANLVSEHEFKAYLDGEVISLKEVGDGVFSEKMVGDGLAIKPANETVCAPVSGKVTVLMEDSKHAVGLTLSNGVEILIHVGIDTVGMGGDGFSYLVKVGDVVKAGTPLLKFSRAKIKAAGHPDTAIFVVTNPNGVDFKFFSGMKARTGQTVIASY